MAKPIKEWKYVCPKDCKNSVEAPPVPSTVRCGVCGTEMEAYAIAEGA